MMLGENGRVEYTQGVQTLGAALGHSQRAADEMLLHEGESGKATRAGGKAITAPRDVERERR